MHWDFMEYVLNYKGFHFWGSTVLGWPRQGVSLGQLEILRIDANMISFCTKDTRLTILAAIAMSVLDTEILS